MMQAIKCEGEEALVAEAIGLAKQRLDFVVDAFDPSVADPVLPPGEDTTGMAQKGLAQRLQLAHRPEARARPKSARSKWF